MGLRAINLDDSPRKELSERVNSRYGWCEITPLSGDQEEGIYMATFADDSRILFEVNDGLLRLMLTKDQEFGWKENLTSEEWIATLEEILLFFLRWKEDQK